MIFANPIVGRTGLCNMLFVWAKSYAFACETGARMLAPQWVNIMRIGPLLRRERSMRYYFGEFTNKGYIGGLTRRIVSVLFVHCSASEMMASTKSRIVDFRWVKGEFFSPILDHQAKIKDELMRIVNPSILKLSQEVPPSGFIGVHIRRGDFSVIGQSVGDDWYVEAITRAQTELGSSSFPILVFSDSDPKDLSGICSKFTNIRVMPKAPAIQDLLMLSRAKILVGTCRSTFSMWAVFLGQMPSIWGRIEIPPPMYVNGLAPILM